MISEDTSPALKSTMRVHVLISPGDAWLLGPGSSSWAKQPRGLRLLTAIQPL